ncbi:MAG: GRAM domain-containing protein [Bacteroidota bacterium]|nr:GRAM domain-containing protein [Bacteroidota bacterium]
MEIGTKIIKLNWKFRVISAILTGFIFAGLLYLKDFFIEEELQSVNSYIFQGVFFGVFMVVGSFFLNEKFGKKAASKFSKNIKPELSENEQIEVEGPANLFRGIEGVGGKIFLTNKKLIFKSHTINIQKGQTDIEYQSIKKIIERKTAKLIDNGIRILTTDGKEFDFVVNEREIWIEKLNEKIK